MTIGFSPKACQIKWEFLVDDEVKIAFAGKIVFKFNALPVSTEDNSRYLYRAPI